MYVFLSLLVMLSVDLITLFSLIRLMFIFHSFRRYFGIEIGHLQMAIYTSRREEMINVVRATLFYMNPEIFVNTIWCRVDLTTLRSAVDT